MADHTKQSEAAAKEQQSAPVEMAGEGFAVLRSSVEKALVKSRTAVKEFRNKTRRLAGPALSRTAVTFRVTSNKSAAGLKSFYNDRLAPAIRQAIRWTADRLNPQSIRRGFRRVLLLVHRFGPDREVERLCFVTTAAHVPLSIVRVPHQLRRTGHDYRPTPKRVFEWAMQIIPEPVNRFEFVDYGAGRGRVLLLASHYPFEKITGAEIAEELHRDCLLNIAQYPRSLMKCRDVNCEHLSALRLDVPEQNTVFYLNNPFDRSMLERVVANIVRAYKQEPRRFYVICVDIDEPDIFEDTGVFHMVPAPWRLRSKIALLSPYSITVYRTIH